MRLVSAASVQEQSYVAVGSHHTLSDDTRINLIKPRQCLPFSDSFWSNCTYTDISITACNFNMVLKLAQVGDAVDTGFQ